MAFELKGRLDHKVEIEATQETEIHMRLSAMSQDELADYLESTIQKTQELVIRLKERRERKINGVLGVMHEQGKDTPARIESLGNRKVVVEKKMDKLEDQMISDLVPRDRIEPKYVPLREELKSIEGEIAKLKRPSANLDEKKIDTIIAFLKDFPKLWSAFRPEEKKQFLKWFVEKVWVQNREVVGIDHTEAFQACIDQDLVRIKSVWLTR